MERRRPRSTGSGAFTLIELMVVVAILGILATLGTSGYLGMVERARVVAAIADIRAMSVSLDEYWIRTGAYPASLAAVGEDDRMDPWGRPYSYKIIGDGGKGVRKDKNLHPINTDYDLYSLGADGKSVAALTAKSSRDDVIRANNGGFIGLAENY